MDRTEPKTEDSVSKSKSKEVAGTLGLGSGWVSGADTGHAPMSALG